jgi:signal transduction histidine kinase
VLLNLLDNAVKYGPVGQTITVGTGMAPDGRAQVWVDDQGSGIPARDKARVWEPFRRLDRAVEAGISGNGIGLAVVHELVIAQGGAVSVLDAPGGGASFVVSLRPGTLSSRNGDESRADTPASFTPGPSSAQTLLQ